MASSDDAGAPWAPGVKIAGLSAWNTTLAAGAGACGTFLHSRPGGDPLESLGETWGETSRGNIPDVLETSGMEESNNTGGMEETSLKDHRPRSKMIQMMETLEASQGCQESQSFYGSPQ